MRHLFSLFCLIIPSVLFAQSPVKTDTVFVRSEKNYKRNFVDYTITKFFVVNGEKEMTITYEMDGTAIDTTMYSFISDYDKPLYQQALRELAIKAKPVEQLTSDEAMVYFEIGSSIEQVAQQLGKKKVNVQPDRFRVAFYNPLMKKDEILDLEFRDGVLFCISRPSTNTLGTNDVWTAFQIIHFENELKKGLNSLLDAMRSSK